MSQLALAVILKVSRDLASHFAIRRLINKTNFKCEQHNAHKYVHFVVSAASTLSE